MTQKESLQKNTLIYGDNLAVLRNLMQNKGEFIDLIYIDPPFNSKRNYNILYENLITEEGLQKTTALKQAFSDTWSNVEIAAQIEELQAIGNRKLYRFLRENREMGVLGDAQMSYAAMMAIRLYYMHACLKPGGSFYLHCDDSAAHLLRMLCDIVFGGENYLNTITWKRAFAHNDAKRYGRVSDTILFYAKNAKQMQFNAQYIEYDKAYIEKFYRHKDRRGRYKNENLTGAGVNRNDKRWRGYHPGEKGHGRHWAIPGRLINRLVAEQKTTAQAVKAMTTGEKLDLLYNNHCIVFSKEGTPTYKQYLDEMPGIPLQDFWGDIPPISSRSKEKLGYHTQKPLKLLERIIACSSKEGDVVADFFCGCGTTIAAAEKLKRKWLGVDISHLAVGLVEEKRLRPIGARYEVKGFPQDAASAEKLAREKPFEFERWIVEKELHGHATKKTGDGGFDGHLSFSLGNGVSGVNGGKIRKQCLLEVKGGQCTVKNVREFDQVITSQKADMGIFICFEKQITKEMRKHCDGAGFLKLHEVPQHFLGVEAGKVPRLLLLTVENILNREYPIYLKSGMQNITY